MLGINVQTVVKIWVSINVQSLSLVEAVVPQGLGMTEAMHMAQQIVMCPQQRHCQLTKANQEINIQENSSAGTVQKCSNMNIIIPFSNSIHTCTC